MDKYNMYYSSYRSVRSEVSCVLLLNAVGKADYSSPIFWPLTKQWRWEAFSVRERLRGPLKSHEW